MSKELSKQFERYSYYIDHLIPVYQPIVGLSDDRIVSYEVLTRICEDNYGLNGSNVDISKCLIRPDVFWKNIDKVGLKIKAKRTFFERLSIDSNRLLKPCTELHVNCTVSGLSLPTTLDAFQDYRARFPKNNLCIEINEQDRLNDTIIQRLVKLQKQGYKIGLDDWGDENKNININFKQLTFLDFVKLDKSLLAKPDQLLRYVKKFKAIGVTNIVVEGVETKEQLDLVQTANCSFVQGYYFGKPSRF